MGEIADQIINGECCELCMTYFDKAHGYPVACPSCWSELSPEDKKKHQKSINEEI